MAKITLHISNIKEGMQCASNVYTSDDKKILDIGSIVTNATIELLKKHAITSLTVTEHLVDPNVERHSEPIKEPEVAVLPPPPKGVFEEGGVHILKIDSKKTEEDLKKSIDKTKHLYETAKSGASMDIAAMKQDVNLMLTNVLENKEAYSHLAMLKRKDETMYKHAVDVSILSALTAKELGMSKTDISNIMLGALLHDIGKVLIQDTVLNKATRTAEDKAAIQKHPTQGYKLVKRDNLEDPIADIVLEHHERYDGRGYPFQKENKDISTYSKIVSICNVFNNLITNGEYGVGVTSDKAVKLIISDAKKQFDSDIVKAFQRAIGLYPNNTRIRLSDGSIVRVIEQNPSLPLRPIVSVAKDPMGKVPDGIITIDLSERPDLFIKEIMS